jgi:hypothetical protein
MPKIDTAKIENYANMTAEEKLAALEAFEYENDGSDAERLKAAVSKANSEAAELKRQLKAKQTEEERKEAERLEAEAAIKAELEALRKDKTISDSKAKFLGLGYDEKLAAETAKALADGDMEKVFANQQIHIENVKKAERAASLANDPKPPAGSGGDAKITKEQFGEMGYAEQLKVFNEQPELYKQLTGGTNNG